MVAFTRILCPIDLSESSTRALAFAAAFARWYQAQLTVLHVVPTFDPMVVRPASLDGSVQMVQPVPREEVLGELRRLVESAGVGPIETTLAAEAGDSSRTIVDQAVALAADLLVMGTHGRSGFERFMVGSVAEKVLQKAPCPVLMVPPHVRTTAAAEVRFRNVLCAMDFSPAALQAFGFALDLARQGEGSVTVVHAIEWLAEDQPRSQAHFNVQEYRRYLADEARQRLQTLAADRPRARSAIQDVVVFGRAHHEILRMAAESPIDLIVMGAQGRGGVGLTLFGSTTQQVVRAAPCPVLSVRAPAPAPAE